MPSPRHAPNVPGARDCDGFWQATSRRRDAGSPVGNAASAATEKELVFPAWLTPSRWEAIKGYFRAPGRNPQLIDEA